MPRTTAISYEDFCAAASEVAGVGGRLTIAALKARLGGGYDVLKRYLDRYEMERAQRRAAAAAPAGLVDGMQALYAQARAEALASVRAELAGEAEDLAAQRTALEIDRAELGARLASATAQASERQGRIEELQAERADLVARLREDQAAIADLHERLQAKQTEVIEQMRLQVHAAAAHGVALADLVVTSQAAHGKAHAEAREGVKQLLGFKDELRQARKAADEQLLAIAPNHAHALQHIGTGLVDVQDRIGKALIQAQHQAATQTSALVVTPHNQGHGGRRRLPAAKARALRRLGTPAK